ncbi:glycoside hydrolase family 76 protein [Sphingobacterium bambusae]|uniref:Glycoside hydrolase family 76 protein n=1 Tax=Sphingobacterium bambusae TaxID=662858 RepID=A0ABW6BMP6_9SPHI|nr:glycoside hydrolase family 76 protein [Sphingobacterium bambusae]WPL47926.1 glycoside hydrolase family 76 protein [Sphingobacterium bambusae]
MKSFFMALSFTVYCSFASATVLPSAGTGIPSAAVAHAEQLHPQALANQNLERAIGLIDVTIAAYFDAQTFEMRRFYHLDKKAKSNERASVWMYTAGIEAVNAVLSGLKAAQEKGEKTLYDRHYARYVQLLDKLYAEADYYLGTFELVSYTQTKSWSVYAVDRVQEKGKANVSGVLNVYDDQMWLIRELLDSYRLTGKRAYLEKAEYLTAYVLDGWDVTRDSQGKENGGIAWGPGYTTKHACSNAPLISSLVWLHELYEGKSDKIAHRFIDAKDRKTRRSAQVKKQQYYLNYARAIYDWQKKQLLTANGVYADMMGGCVPNCDIRYEEQDGQRYRANTPLTAAVGKAYSYNSGTMLSGAVDLHRATGEAIYAQDGRLLAKNSFRQFASLGKDVPQYYSFETSGFNNWFNGILLRGYHEATVLDAGIGDYVTAFQRNLDYGFAHFNRDGFLPTDLLKGWAAEKEPQGLEGMFMFTYAAQYALLGKHQLEQQE